jgi:hypothetical protein
MRRRTRALILRILPREAEFTGLREYDGLGWDGSEGRVERSIGG